MTQLNEQSNEWIASISNGQWASKRGLQFERVYSGFSGAVALHLVNEATDSGTVPQAARMLEKPLVGCMLSPTQMSLV